MRLECEICGAWTYMEAPPANNMCPVCRTIGSVYICEDKQPNPENRNEALAMDIYRWCKKHEIWQDITMYFDGMAFSSHGWEWDGEMPVCQIEEDLWVYANKNPLRYFEYANPKTFSMSFEGPLYEVLNAYVPGWVKLEDEFLKIFEKHGYYYELGHAWNLAACEL